MNDLNTRFVARLRARDPKAWFELWETFGPVLRAQLARWGRGRIGHETVQDLSQETLTALSSAIDRHDPERGARFSTWLLAIAKHTLGDELDRRGAQKRGSGKRASSIDELTLEPGVVVAPDAEYERAVFEAKVEAALRAVERSSEFLDFSIYRMRVLDGRGGREVAESLGISPATVSRRLTAVREQVRERLREVFARYSFTPEELDELSRNGIDPNPKKEDDVRFDEAMGELYHRVAHRRGQQDGVGASDGAR